MKENGPDLLRLALSRVPVDVVMPGDNQGAARTGEASGKMLQVCYEPGFPVAVLARSPLVLRDLEPLQDITERATAVVFFSIISPPDSPAYERVRQMENLAPARENRFEAMELKNALGQRAWAWRTAAWAIEDLEPDVGLIYRQMG